MGTATIALLLTRSWRATTKSFREAKELLGYGLQRIPGDFALSALLALPTILIAHLQGIRQAGLVAFGIAIVNIIAAVFSPVGLVLLPKVSNKLGQGALAEMRQEVLIIFGIAVALPLTCILLFELLGAWLIRVYLGPDLLGAVAGAKLLVISALPLCVFYALRGVIDAIHENAVNSANLLISLAVFSAGASVAIGMMRNPRMVLWAFVSAVTVLAMLTIRETLRILRAAQAATPLERQALGFNEIEPVL